VHSQCVATVASFRLRTLRSQRRAWGLRLLWKATRDGAHLDEVKRLLDDLLARNPPEYRESMCRHRRVNREILAAWRQEFGEDADDGHPGGTEPATRVG